MNRLINFSATFLKNSADIENINSIAEFLLDFRKISSAFDTFLKSTEFCEIRKKIGKIVCEFRKIFVKFALVNVANTRKQSATYQKRNVT